MQVTNMMFVRHDNTSSARESPSYNKFIFLAATVLSLATLCLSSRTIVDGSPEMYNYCTMKCTDYFGRDTCNINFQCSLFEWRPECSTCNEGGVVGDRFTDCYDAYQAGNREDGVYTISPRDWPGLPFPVLCNMTSDGGGWTVFQRRVDGRTDFYRSWQEYKNGFGSPSLDRDFWLGNEKLYYLTGQKNYEIRIDMVTSGNDHLFQKYNSFSILSESSNYRLRLTEANDRTGMYFNNGRYFSTYDRDSDRCSAHNCAREHRGGWWYGGARNWCHSCYWSHCSNFRKGWCSTACTDSNLNGDYDGGSGQSIIWYRDALGRHCNMKYADMKIRPHYPLC